MDNEEDIDIELDINEIDHYSVVRNNKEYVAGEVKIFTREEIERFNKVGL